MKKAERIRLVIENISRNSSLLHGKVTFKEIMAYIKDNNLNWNYEEIGRTQKIDLIKSIRKNNTIPDMVEEY